MSRQELMGHLFRSSEDTLHTTVSVLSNEKSVDNAIHTFKGSGHLVHFMDSVKSAQRALVEDLRAANVAVADADQTHLKGVCGVRCRSEDSCTHVVSGEDIRTFYLDHENKIVGAEGQAWKRVLVCLHASRTKLRDVCLECFPRSVQSPTPRDELVVRVHTYYPNDIPCGCSYDLRGRLVTQKLFVSKGARTSHGYHVFHYASRSGKKGPPSKCDEMFPDTKRGEEYQGFSIEKRCTAITVETVFVRDATRGRAPHYREDAAQTRTYLSYLRASELVTDDELAAHLALVPPDARAMPAFADDRAAEKLNVLVRLYLLAHDQGWTASLSAGSPHPLGRPQLPVLYRAPATEVDVADRRDPQAPALLRQALQPDAESQITRFCFRRVVSEALRRRVVARGAEAAAEAAAAHYDAVVCYMPHGDRVPALTDAQVAVLAALHPALGIRRPATRAEWGRLSQTLYQHGVALLDVLRAVGTPLVDASGAEIAADAYVPYTPDMAQDFFLVVVNRPLRDYTCVVNQRWLLDDLLRRTCDTATTRDGFRAWVRYWNTVVQLKHELEEQLGVDTVSAHLGQRLPRGARGEAAACLVSGRVTDTKGGLVFPDLGGQRFADAAHVGHLPPGTAVVYRMTYDGTALHREFVPSPYVSLQNLDVYPPEAERAAKHRAKAQRREVMLGWREETVEMNKDEGSSEARAASTAASEEEAVPAAAPNPYLTTRRVGLGSMGYGVTVLKAPALLPTGYRSPEPEEVAPPPEPWHDDGDDRGGQRPSYGSRQASPHGAPYRQASDFDRRQRGRGMAGSGGSLRGGFGGRGKQPQRFKEDEERRWSSARREERSHSRRGGYRDAYDEEEERYGGYGGRDNYRPRGGASPSRRYEDEEPPFRYQDKRSSSSSSRGRGRGRGGGGFGSARDYDRYDRYDEPMDDDYGGRRGRQQGWGREEHAPRHDSRRGMSGRDAGPRSYERQSSRHNARGDDDWEDAWDRRPAERHGSAGGRGRDDCFFDPDYVPMINQSASRGHNGRGGGGRGGRR